MEPSPTVTAHLTLVLTPIEAQQLFNALGDYLEDFWIHNDPQDTSDLEFNDSIRRICTALEPWVIQIDQQMGLAGEENLDDSQ